MKNCLGLVSDNTGIHLKILLVRHGKPQVPAFGKLKASEFSKWINTYNSAGIDRQFTAPAPVSAAVTQCAAILCSDLPRSIESAQALGIQSITEIDPQLREIDLPCAEWNFPKLSLNFWVPFFRILWFMGYSRHSETLSQARARAHSASTKLQTIARQQGSVAFIGHGMINRLIADDLRRNNWQGPKNPGKRYWDFGVYETRS